MTRSAAGLTVERGGAATVAGRPDTFSLFDVLRVAISENVGGRVAFDGPERSVLRHIAGGDVAAVRVAGHDLDGLPPVPAWAMWAVVASWLPGVLWCEGSAVASLGVAAVVKLEWEGVAEPHAADLERLALALSAVQVNTLGDRERVSYVGR